MSLGLFSWRKTGAHLPTLGANNSSDSFVQQLMQFCKTFSQGRESNYVKYLCSTGSGVGIVKHES